MHLRKTMTCPRWLILITVSLAAHGCSKIEYTDQWGREVAPVDIKSVVVFKSEEELKVDNRKFDVMGQAVVTGNKLASRDSMRDKIIKMAAKKGADAVVFVYANDLSPKPEFRKSPPITSGGDFVYIKSKQPSAGKKRVKAFLLKFR